MMETGAYPLSRCKTIHFVRHAEGIHNVHDPNMPKTSPLLFDARLSPLGWQQVQHLRKHVRDSGLMQSIELVIVSPLLRTLQTAAGVFGGEDHINGSKGSPLMLENVYSEHTAVSSLNCPPFVAQELCRERLGINTCDKRRSISEYQSVFPAVDFSLIESDKDILWTADVRESDEELSARGLKFINWLCTRKEKEIAVVTHSAFLYETLKVIASDYHPSVRTQVCSFFKNCELRSLVLVDRSLMGADAATMHQPETTCRLTTPSNKSNGEEGESNHSKT